MNCSVATLPGAGMQVVNSSHVGGVSMRKPQKGVCCAPSRIPGNKCDACGQFCSHCGQWFCNKHLQVSTSFTSLTGHNCPEAPVDEPLAVAEPPAVAGPPVNPDDACWDDWDMAPDDGFSRPNKFSRMSVAKPAPMPRMRTQVMRSEVVEEHVAEWVFRIMRLAFPPDVDTAQLRDDTIRSIIALKHSSGRGSLGFNPHDGLRKQVELATPSLGGLGGCVVAIITASYSPHTRKWDLCGAYVTNIGCMRAGAASDPNKRKMLQSAAKKELLDLLGGLSL